MLVVYEEFAVAVGDGATGGEFYFFQECVTVGILLVVLTHDLQHEESYDVDDDDDHGNAANHVFPVF